MGDTTAQLETYFNANLSNFGTWSIINISGTNATIRCVLKDDATATGGIDTNASTKGAVALSLIDDSERGYFYELKDKNYWVVHTDELKLLFQ